MTASSFLYFGRDGVIRTLDSLHSVLGKSNILGRSSVVAKVGGGLPLDQQRLPSVFDHGAHQINPPARPRQPASSHKEFAGHHASV